MANAPRSTVSSRVSATVRRHGRALRILLSVTLIWLLLRQVSVDEMLLYWNSALHNWPYLAFSQLLPSLGFLIAALRLYVLLPAQGIRVPLPEMYLMTWISTVYNQLLPSTIGADVVRGLWLRRQEPVSRPPTEAANPYVASFSVIALDRGMGLMGLLFAGMAAVLANPEILQHAPAATVIVPMSIVAILLLLALSRIPMRSLGLKLFSLRALAPIRDKGQTVYRTIRLYDGQKAALLLAFLFAVGLQLAVILQYWVLSVALDLDVPFRVLAIIIPIVTVISMLPISINGIGVTESAVYILGSPFGMTVGGAIAIAWLVLSSKLIWALAGALLNIRLRII